MEMAVRVLVVLLFTISTLILTFAFFRRPYTYHLVGIIIWCLHVILFTVCAMLRAIGVFSVDSYVLNIWSNIVRIHGGIVMLSTGLYYVDRKDALR